MMEGITRNWATESFWTVFYMMKNRLLIYKVKKKKFFSRTAKKELLQPWTKYL